MAQLATLEAKMASIEVSLSASNTPRRRKGTSLGGASSISARASPRPPSAAAISVADTKIQQQQSQQQQHAAVAGKELRTALQDREAVIQNLRLQLGLGKMPRPLGNAPLDDAERPAAEQQLARLKHDADIKRVQIRNLKLALDKLDITDNIDARIRQAELEYALGREELQMLSLVEEARALQTRMDKSRPEANSLYSTIQSGTQLCLQAVQATVGRWAACSKANSPGMWVEWALDGEGLYRGDRILEVNGAILTCKTREELHKLIGVSGRCQLVVVRKRSSLVPQQQQLVQSQEDNQRLQHRISYLEDQVKELLTTAKEQHQHQQQQQQHHQHQLLPTTNGAHVTSISISSGHSSSTTTSRTTPSPPDSSASTTSTTNNNGTAEKPQIYQRGNFVTTIIGGKALTTPEDVPSPSQQITATSMAHITKTVIKDATASAAAGNGIISNGHISDSGSNRLKALSASKISINSDTSHIKRDRHREARRLDDPQQQHQQQQLRNERRHHHPVLSEYAAGSGTDTESLQRSSTSKQQQQQQHYQVINSTRHHRSRHSEGGHYNGLASYARSVEQLNLANGLSERRKDDRALLLSAASIANGYRHHHHQQQRDRQTPTDMRSVKSLDFDSDAGGTTTTTNGTTNGTHRNHHHYSKQHQAQAARDVDYTSEPVPQHRVRPMPPKKPLRLSLQRAQSLQTVEANMSELDRKRAMKRTHKGTSSEMLQFIENNVPFHTSSLGRNNYV